MKTAAFAVREQSPTPKVHQKPSNSPVARRVAGVAAAVLATAEWFSSTSFNCFGNVADPCTSGPGKYTAHTAAINHTDTFSPTLVLNLVFGYVRRLDNFPGIKGALPSIGTSFSQLGLPSYLNNGFGVLPAIQISGYSSGNAGNNIGTQTFSVTREGQDTAHLGGAVSWVRGQHELKFGGAGRLHRINHGNPGWPAGDFSFDFSSTSQFATQFGTNNNGFPLAGGDGLASFLTGVGSPNQSGGGCRGRNAFGVPRRIIQHLQPSAVPGARRHPWFKHVRFDHFHGQQSSGTAAGFESVLLNTGILFSHAGDG